MPYADPEKKREANHKWRAANPEKNREAKRKWREANPEKAREATHKWRAAYPEKARATKRAADSKYRASLKGRITVMRSEQAAKLRSLEERITNGYL